MSSILIGAVVVGLGTSLPEMLVSGLAANRPGGMDLALGNVVGSNVANLSLVLGLSITISPIVNPRVVMRREGALMLASGVVLTFMAWDASLSRVEGFVLLALMAAVLVLLVRWSKTDTSAIVEAEVAEFADGEGEVRTGREVIIALAALALTLAGARLLVVGAEGLALRFGISEGLIGLTLVAIGTSLPELATAVAAARRHENDIVLGNVLGSNLFNTLAVAGVSGVVGGRHPFTTDFSTPLVVMLAIGALTAVIAITGDRLGRREGILLLGVYPAAIALVA
jgi:cation:H+ antiporter